MRIGIFGCTADPFTCAHYEIVNGILGKGVVDKVIVIPTIVNYYRTGKKPFFDFESRRKIIETWFEKRNDVILDFHEYAVAGDPNRNPDEISMRRYWHTYLDLRMRYGDNEYFTVIGEDSWDRITSWYNFEELKEKTRFIVFIRENKRTGYGIGLKDGVYEPYCVLDIAGSFASVSATRIREIMTELYGPGSENGNGPALNWYLGKIKEYMNTGIWKNPYTENSRM